MKARRERRGSKSLAESRVPVSQKPSSRAFTSLSPARPCRFLGSSHRVTAADNDNERESDVTGRRDLFFFFFSFFLYFFFFFFSRKPRDDEPSLPFTGLLRWRAFNGSLSPLPPSFPERIVLPFFFPSFLSSVSAISIFCCYQFLGRKFLPPRDKQPVYLSFYLSVHHFLSSLRDGLLWPGWLLRKRGMEKGIREEVIVLPRIRWSENTQVLDRIVRKVINLFHPLEYNIKVYK